jgi:hypothetical protein
MNMTTFLAMFAAVAIVVSAKFEGPYPPDINEKPAGVLAVCAT